MFQAPGRALGFGLPDGVQDLLQRPLAHDDFLLAEHPGIVKFGDGVADRGQVDA